MALEFLHGYTTATSQFHDMLRLINYIHDYRLVDDITLKDLQEEIFAKIPELIAESNLHTTLDIKSIDPKEEKNVLNVKAVEEIVLDVKTESITEIDGLGDNINEFSEFLSLEDNDFKDDKIYKVCHFKACTNYKPNLLS